MHSELRQRFNADFTPEKYAAMLRCVNETEKWPADFRVSETPIFLTHEFSGEVQRAAKEIVDLTHTPVFVRHSQSAIPKELEVPNESAHPNFLVVDFGICSEDGKLVPRLIELQAFASLFGFQWLLLGCMRKNYPAIPMTWTSSFGGINDNAYLQLLMRAIVADADPKHVVLLEIEPEKQKTRVDFAATESMLGIRSVCVTRVKKRGRELFYDRDGTETRIDRIYNRVIFDELLRRNDLDLNFRFQDDVAVKWIGHPNWYFRISKHSLPFLRTPHTSPAFFADQFPVDEKIEHYVLKPLYSFAGLGVDMEPTREKLAGLKDPHQWILQKKVEYAAFVPTVDGPKSKAEIRMMFVWPEEDRHPTLVNNLVRMSQGKMMGVDFNKDKTWVGSSIALHEQ
ncbi:MAG TPA: hypothetical protein VGW97_01215 [Chthoniobacterales bacterium]|jgi:hypothetical protein|nr:hypothetical protein [Chthoniobacterales bacterium]